jgi:hypothetical protein
VVVSEEDEMKHTFRTMAVTAMLVVGVMMLALPAHAFTKYNQGGTPGKATVPVMKGTASQITYSTAQFQGRTVYRTTENNPAGYPLSQSVNVTYQLWRYDTATAKWIKTNAITRSGSFGTSGSAVGISGVNIPLQQHGWYSADVKIQWIGNNGTVVGSALYDYDLVADYSCNCSTWQGAGIAAMYL